MTDDELIAEARKKIPDLQALFDDFDELPELISPDKIKAATPDERKDLALGARSIAAALRKTISILETAAEAAERADGR